MTDAPARYFPVRPEPLRMQAGLHRFGTDFGQGERDGKYFQVDTEFEATLQAKREISARSSRLTLTTSTWGQSPAGRRQLEAAATWAWDMAGRDGVLLPSRTEEAPSAALEQLCFGVQEDLVVLARKDDGAEEASFVHVCFPSGWRPENIVAADFLQIHAPVPRFADEPTVARSMTSSMIDRGPYVRFVWTVSADANLDHHPETGSRWPFSLDASCYLRVERQTTVPLPGYDAALFLIRTYVRSFDLLSERETAVLHAAVAQMPVELLRYKGLLAGQRAILAALETKRP